MGQDVLSRIGAGLPIVNVQKGRIDYLLDVRQNPGLRPRVMAVARHMARKDIIPLIAQQEAVVRCFPRRSPAMLLMDSFAELTDQLFVHRTKGWRFCCHYSDLKHTDAFGRRFRAQGLLDVDQLHGFYTRFFESFRQRYGHVPIVFMHFPAKLDSRKKFHTRYEYIRNAIGEMENRFQPFHSIAIDDSVVDWPERRTPELEDFPYHYNDTTYEGLVEGVRQTGVFTRLNKAA